MRNNIKIIIAVSIWTAFAVLAMFGVLYAGNWFLDTIGMTCETANDIITLFLTACYALLFSVAALCVAFFYSRMWWKERKRRKQEAEAARQADALKKPGRTEHGH